MNHAAPLAALVGTFISVGVALFVVLRKKPRA